MTQCAVPATLVTIEDEHHSEACPTQPNLYVDDANSVPDQHQKRRYAHVPERPL
jgi:hypothetical protein